MYWLATIVLLSCTGFYYRNPPTAGEEILQPAWRTKKSGIILPSNQVCMFAITKMMLIYIQL